MYRGVGRVSRTSKGQRSTPEAGPGLGGGGATAPLRKGRITQATWRWDSSGAPV